jgi:hypothetical protein
VGLVLIVAPWTGFWENNVFVIASENLSAILLSPWLRGGLSGVGVVTFVAGLLDLIGLFVHRETSGSRSAQAPH